MSREERRAYQRLMKNQDRTAALPPAARARAERQAAKRARLRSNRGSGAGEMTIGFWIRSILVAALAGLIGFSLQWPQMPFALYVGIAVMVVVLGLLVGFRLLQRRSSSASS
jgi:Flp pilus assembly protein TadB